MVAVANGGDGNIQYSATGLPPGVFIEPTNGNVYGTIAGNADTGSPYSVTIFADDSDADPSDVISSILPGPLTRILPLYTESMQRVLNSQMPMGMCGPRTTILQAGVPMSTMDWR